jgi:hypothetical protein
MRGAAALVVVCAVAVAGCRATPVTPPDDMGVDLAVAADDLAGVDAAVGPDLACAVTGTEVCGNGCDDDGNGYVDDDDPACTTQMLVTLTIGAEGTPALWRLILEPTPHVAVLDGNPVDQTTMAVYDRAFAPAAFIAHEGAARTLERRPLGGTATMYGTSYGLRDACVFNGELIVLEPKKLATGSGVLHRFAADGMTELGTVPVADIATACSSDGTMLYVASHPNPGDSVIHVFAKGASGPTDTGMTIALPSALLTIGYTRLVDLVYVKKSHSFIGLFAKPGSAVDSALNGDVMAPFAFDGGVGPFIDGGVWHGAGEFMP